MLTAARHYQDMAHQAQKDRFTSELSKAILRLSLAIQYPTEHGRDLSTALEHIANAQTAAREMDK